MPFDSRGYPGGPGGTRRPEVNAAGADIDERIRVVLSEFKLLSPFFAGYPVNQRFDYSRFCPLLDYCGNSIGDPFGYSRYQSNTHEVERDVVQAMAKLARLPAAEAW